jgi:two-component system, response regulator YesN
LAYSPEIEQSFDIELAKDCAKAYAASTNLGATVSYANGETINEYGYGYESCRICEQAGQDKEHCRMAHNNAVKEAERFGGKYIYFCPLGLTCFVTPIVGNEVAEAKITIGPFLMVEQQDYIFYDLLTQFQLNKTQRRNITKSLESISYVSPNKVNDLSSLLFMAVGFMNNIWSVNNMLDTQMSFSLQNHIPSQVSKLKGHIIPPTYPFDLETKLLDAIADADRELANKYLNELFGYIFFTTANTFSLAKSRVYELLVLIARTAIKSGADPEETLALSHEFMQVIPTLESLEDMCFWLVKITNRLIDLFSYFDVKHANVIHKATLYIHQNYDQKITLESIARIVYLSPAYFSRIFKKEMGITFNAFVNNIRIEKSKSLLKDNQLKMLDIALLVGFESQSYFTKVFKKTTGVSPFQYREKHSM